jgi:lysophospholipase L1-like esterase
VTTYLLGDSHVANLGPTVPALGAAVVNLAAGGAVAQDLACQLHDVGLPDDATLVVSIGTNDADPTRGLRLDAFGAVVDAFVAARPGRHWVYVASPGCAGDIDDAWTDAGMARYSARAAEAFAAQGGSVIDTPALLAALGKEAFEQDRLHLSARGYAVLLPALAGALAAAPVPPRAPSAGQPDPGSVPGPSGVG